MPDTTYNLQLHFRPLDVLLLAVLFEKKEIVIIIIIGAQSLSIIISLSLLLRLKLLTQIWMDWTEKR